MPPFAEVASPAEAASFAEEHGWPIVLKARHGGYDGRGVSVVSDRLELGGLFAAAPPGTGEPGNVGPHSRRYVAEAYLRLEHELAVLVARNDDGETAVYPVVETYQHDGICVELTVPATIDAALAARASELAVAVATHAGATGICAVELFCEPGGRLSVNELALRPHNSGHATIEACLTSQFHQHLRAVLGWPLGDPSLVVPAAAMVNLIGGPSPVDPVRRLAERDVGAAAVHLYGKALRPGRKVGHVTAVGATAADALGRARAAAEVLLG